MRKPSDLEYENAKRKGARSGARPEDAHSQTNTSAGPSFSSALFLVSIPADSTNRYQVGSGVSDVGRMSSSKVAPAAAGPSGSGSSSSKIALKPKDATDLKLTVGSRVVICQDTKLR